MINDLKLGFRLLKYAHAYKMNLIFGLMMSALGVVMCLMSVVSVQTRNPMWGYFVVMISVFLLQMLWSVNTASLVQASPMKKKLQTLIPVLLGGFSIMTGYVLFVLLEGIVAVVHPEAMAENCSWIIYSAILMTMLLLYVAFCYKYFFAGTLIFCFCCYVVSVVYMRIFQETLSACFQSGWWSFVLAAMLGILILCLGVVLNYLISLAVYKVPISKFSQTASLRQQM